MAGPAARSAPTTAAALAVAGDELGERFGVRVEVSATALTGRSRSGPTEREEIVMIAREAIVNAIKHGHARRIDVILDLDGKRPLLLVRDDGGGVTSSTPGSVSGCRRCGLVESLGGRLVLRGGAGGGTELEVRVAAQTPTRRPAIPTPSR